jgi:hypothetical protein
VEQRESKREEKDWVRKGKFFVNIVLCLNVVNSSWIHKHHVVRSLVGRAMMIEIVQSIMENILQMPNEDPF